MMYLLSRIAKTVLIFSLQIQETGGLMINNLYLFLDKMAFENVRLEITTSSGGVFTGVSAGDDQADIDEGLMGWYFTAVEGSKYNVLYLKDIARVRRVGEKEYAYTAGEELAVAS